jgi:hypothetical protein
LFGWKSVGQKRQETKFSFTQQVAYRLVKPEDVEKDQSVLYVRLQLPVNFDRRVGRMTDNSAGSGIATHSAADRHKRPAAARRSPN